MYSAISRNKSRTILLMVGFVAFMAVVGFVLDRAFASTGLFVGVVVFAIIYSIASYFMAAKLALALSSAKPVAKADQPELYRVVENLAIAAGLPTPQIYLIDDAAPNAFATGRDPAHAYVAVTSGLLAMMDKEELEGVIAHELSHVGNYDIRLMAIVIALVSIVSLVSHFFLRMTFWGGNRRGNNQDEAGGLFLIIGLVAAILAPIVATLVQLAVSRRREYLADAAGALLTRYPDGLASALTKIGTYSRPMQHASTATAHLFIANPLGNGRGIGGRIAGLFSTHPPIGDRIKRLEEMERTV